METLPNPKVLARIVARLTHGHVEPPVLTGGKVPYMILSPEEPAPP